MNAVDLQRPDFLPEALRVRLESIKSFCRNEEFSENLVQHPKVREVVIELDHYCMQRQILGIHYTRAIHADIVQKGLLVRTGAEIRDDFVQRFGHKFDVEEMARLQNLWYSHQVKQSDIRDSMLWFNFTLSAYGNSGSEYLLGMYGGEQIHMGIELGTPIGKKLASIGEPLLVKCALDPQKVETFIEKPWGKILASSYHLSLEPEAYRIDQDGKVTESISPDDLVVESVH
ncbi:MAG: hypothetical protein KZQ91_03380 [Candidatus Thiodiazotropha sp. (ex Lucinoma borealis)]|nr:hypothetical protein [Candidatus Thiodiazotropha sp. (ex Lucinoma borealis)]